MLALPPDERDRRWRKIRKAMETRNLECLIVWGSSGTVGSLYANLMYLTNSKEQGYLVFPLEGEPAFFIFLGDHGSKAEQRPWVTDIRTGHPAYSKAISERLRELHFENARIGMIGASGYQGEMGFPYTTYISLIDNFPTANFEDATDLMEEARKIKSTAEIRCLEIACEVGDKVIQAIVDAAKVGVRDYEIRDKIRETLLRSGSSPGSLLLYCSGKELDHAMQGDPLSSRALEYGDVILTEFNAEYAGYLAQYNQPFSVGEPNKEWLDIFAVALESFNSGLKALRPGITVGEFDEVLLLPIKEAGYTFREPAFHGIGLAIEEPIGTFPAQPEYKTNASLRIEAGMVFEIEPHVVTLDGKKGLHIGSSVVVTETGCRLLSKTWKPEFKVV